MQLEQLQLSDRRFATNSTRRAFVPVRSKLGVFFMNYFLLRFYLVFVSHKILINYEDIQSLTFNT